VTNSQIEFAGVVSPLLAAKSRSTGSSVSSLAALNLRNSVWFATDAIGSATTQEVKHRHSSLRGITLPTTLPTTGLVWKKFPYRFLSVTGGKIALHRFKCVVVGGT
jgi:hypothetical protein